MSTVSMQGLERTDGYRMGSFQQGIPADAVQTSKPHPPRLAAKAESSSAIGRVASLFEKVIWEFVNQTGNVVKQICKAVLVTCPAYAVRLSKVIAHIGFLAGINLIMNFKDLPGQLANWYQNIPLEDLEGGILGTLDLFATLGSMLNDVSTVSSSLAALGAIPTIAFFGAIGIPLGMGLLSYAIVSRTYSLGRNCQFVSSLPKEITEENIEEFKKMIAEKVDDPVAKLKQKKIRVLSRYADPKVTAIMQKLHIHLSKHPEDVATANSALKDIRTLMKRKVTLGVASTVANTAMLTALAASLICPAAAIVVPFVGLAKASTAIGTHAYKTFRFESGLQSPELMEAAS